MKVPTALSSRARRRVAAAALYVGLALWATWPLARAPATALPLGTEKAATVPQFNLWTIWWNADRARYGWSGYWDAPIFYPADDTFAFSEPQPATALVAPVIWLTGSRGLAYNFYLWLSLVLNGVFAERLLRLLGMRGLVAVGGGAAMLLLPIVHWQLGVLQLVPLWGILWTWSAVLRVSRRPSPLRGVELGAAFGAAFLTCAHHGLFLAVLLAGSLWALGKRWLQPRLWLAGLSAVAVAALLAGPLAAKLHHVMATHEFARPPDTVAQLSAQPGDYTAASGTPLIDFGHAAARPRWRLSPGWLKLGLAVVGLVFGMTRRRWRCWRAFLLVTAVLAFLLSLGPNLRLHHWQPWWTLAQLVPGFPQVRNVFRFAYFVQMAAVLLAAQGVHGIWLLSHRFAQRRSRRFAVAAVLMSIGLAAIFETRPAATRLAAVPDAAAHADWIEFVRTQTPPGRAIACLPFAAGNRVGDFEVTTRWMYFGTFHGVPLVNGYSGFFPRPYFDVRQTLNASFPSEEALQKLLNANVEFLVVDRSAVSAERFSRTEFETAALRRVLAGSQGIDVYRVERTR